MKKLIYLLFTALLVLSCNTSDDNQLKNNESIDNSSDDTINYPYPPDRSYNMHYILLLKFVNESGINILDLQEPIIDYNLINIDIYAADDYQNEFPYDLNYSRAKCISFIDIVEFSSVFKMNSYTYKSEAFEQLLGQRKWEQFRITFPDGAEYIIKVEGEFRGNSNVDLFPQRVYVNNELRFEQDPNALTPQIDLTIVK